MASEIDELKEIVRHQSEVIEDTNRQIHKMRRGARWAMVFQVLWWLTIAGVTGAVYYYYLMPYLQGIMAAYQNVQHAGGQTQEYQTQFMSFIQKFFGSSTPSK